MKIFCLTILSFLLTGVFINAQEIKPIDQWMGKSRDEAHKDAGPKSGLIVDSKAWAEIWSKWHVDEELPKVDFATDLVLVATVSGPNRMLVGNLRINNEDLLFRPGATRMGGPGFGHILVQVRRGGFDSVNQVPIPKGAVVEDSIQVDVFGTIHTGIMAIGGESTGTTITANNVTWELQLTDEYAKQVQSLNGKKVRVKGELNKRTGVEIAERWIVTVSSLGQGDDGHAENADNGFAFQTIVLETSGGFAGIKQTMTIHADGRVIGENRAGEKRELQWPKQKLAELHRHIGETDWSKVPAETRNKNVADDFQHDFIIEAGPKKLRFTIDGTSLPKVPSLQRLMEIIQ